MQNIDGIAFYSLFQLPEDKLKRKSVIRKVLEKKKTLYFALEGLQMKNETDYDRIETFWKVRQTS